MRFHNATDMRAAWTLGFEPDGRELLVVAIKGTFGMPSDGDEPALTAEQLPLTMADEFTGEPGMSAPLRETDFAHRKLMCDVLLNGSAHAPGRRPSERVTVGLRVGAMTKMFDVVGDRVWWRGALGIAPLPPRAFVIMPISFDKAFGGTEPDSSNRGVRTYERNPIGKGFGTGREDVGGKPLPNTEELNRPVTDPTGEYVPMSFGPIGRNWWPRRRHAGTYDSKWLETRAPFWPPDFSYRYFQSAPDDQQIPFPSGGEPVVLQNLTPDGLRTFTLPRITLPVLFVPRRGPDKLAEAVIDTLLLEPDFNRFTLTWRANLPLRRNCFELKETIVGEMPAAWHRTRRTANKRYFAGLGELAAAKRGRAQS
jgi:hypothetical protein